MGYSDATVARAGTGKRRACGKGPDWTGGAVTALFLLIAFLGLVFCAAAIVSDAIELYVNRNQARRRQHDPRYWNTHRGNR